MLKKLFPKILLFISATLLVVLIGQTQLMKKGKTDTASFDISADGAIHASTSAGETNLPEANWQSDTTQQPDITQQSGNMEQPSSTQQPGNMQSTDYVSQSQAAQQNGTKELYAAWSDVRDALPQAGRASMENLLVTAIQPLGSTMYIWGGGWNEEDTGAGIEAVTIGISPQWKAYFELQDASYNYKNTRYQIHNGLDCSGFVGWTIYNVLESENEQTGYVMKAKKMAQQLAQDGFGDYYASGMADTFCPGDIVSMKGHVWICLGTCEDGSVLLIHSSPPGVKVSGTCGKNGERTDAIELAEEVMKRYPGWYDRYPDCTVSHNYIENVEVMRWNEQTLTDEWNLQEKTAEDIVLMLWGE